MTIELSGESEPRSPAARFAYDVFVVHADADADAAFVNGYLLAKLGLAPERVLRLQTLELGQSITREIERGVRSSRVTIVVLSSAYMDDRWAAFGEQLAAYASVAKDVHGVLLPLVLQGSLRAIHKGWRSNRSGSRLGSLGRTRPRWLMAAKRCCMASRSERFAAGASRT